MAECETKSVPYEDVCKYTTMLLHTLASFERPVSSQELADHITKDSPVAVPDVVLVIQLIMELSVSQNLVKQEDGRFSIMPKESLGRDGSPGKSYCAETKTVTADGILMDGDEQPGCSDGKALSDADDDSEKADDVDQTCDFDSQTVNPSSSAAVSFESWDDLPESSTAGSLNLHQDNQPILKVNLSVHSNSAIDIVSCSSGIGSQSDDVRTFIMDRQNQVDYSRQRNFEACTSDKAAVVVGGVMSDKAADITVDQNQQPDCSHHLLVEELISDKVSVVSASGELILDKPDDIAMQQAPDCCHQQIVGASNSVEEAVLSARVALVSDEANGCYSKIVHPHASLGTDIDCSGSYTAGDIKIDSHTTVSPCSVGVASGLSEKRRADGVVIDQADPTEHLCCHSVDANASENTAIGSCSDISASSIFGSIMMDQSDQTSYIHPPTMDSSCLVEIAFVPNRRFSEEQRADRIAIDKTDPAERSRCMTVGESQNLLSLSGLASGVMVDEADQTHLMRPQTVDSSCLVAIPFMANRGICVSQKPSEVVEDQADKSHWSGSQTEDEKSSHEILVESYNDMSASGISGGVMMGQSSCLHSQTIDSSCSVAIPFVPKLIFPEHHRAGGAAMEKTVQPKRRRSHSVDARSSNDTTIGSRSKLSASSISGSLILDPCYQHSCHHPTKDDSSSSVAIAFVSNHGLSQQPRAGGVAMEQAYLPESSHSQNIIPNLSDGTAIGSRSDISASSISGSITMKPAGQTDCFLRPTVDSSCSVAIPFIATRGLSESHKASGESLDQSGQSVCACYQTYDGESAHEAAIQSHSDMSASSLSGNIMMDLPGQTICFHPQIVDTSFPEAIAFVPNCGILEQHRAGVVLTGFPSSKTVDTNSSNETAIGSRSDLSESNIPGRIVMDPSDQTRLFYQTRIVDSFCSAIDQSACSSFQTGDEFSSHETAIESQSDMSASGIPRSVMMDPSDQTNCLLPPTVDSSSAVAIAFLPNRGLVEELRDGGVTIGKADHHKRSHSQAVHANSSDETSMKSQSDLSSSSVACDVMINQSDQDCCLGPQTVDSVCSAAITFVDGRGMSLSQKASEVIVDQADQSACFSFQTESGNSSHKNATEAHSDMSTSSISADIMMDPSEHTSCLHPPTTDTSCSIAISFVRNDGFFEQHRAGGVRIVQPNQPECSRLQTVNANSSDETAIGSRINISSSSTSSSITMDLSDQFSSLHHPTMDSSCSLPRASMTNHGLSIQHKAGKVDKADQPEWSRPQTISTNSSDEAAIISESDLVASSKAGGITMQHALINCLHPQTVDSFSSGTIAFVPNHGSSEEDRAGEIALSHDYRPECFRPETNMDTHSSDNAAIRSHIDILVSSIAGGITMDQADQPKRSHSQPVDASSSDQTAIESSGDISPSNIAGGILMDQAEQPRCSACQTTNTNSANNDKLASGLASEQASYFYQNDELVEACYEGTSVVGKDLSVSSNHFGFMSDNSSGISMEKEHQHHANHHQTYHDSNSCPVSFLSGNFGSESDQASDIMTSQDRDNYSCYQDRCASTVAFVVEPDCWPTASDAPVRVRKDEGDKPGYPCSNTVNLSSSNETAITLQICALHPDTLEEASATSISFESDCGLLESQTAADLIKTQDHQRVHCHQHILESSSSVDFGTFSERIGSESCDSAGIIMNTGNYNQPSGSLDQTVEASISGVSTSDSVGSQSDISGGKLLNEDNYNQPGSSHHETCESSTSGPVSFVSASVELMSAEEPDVSLDQGDQPGCFLDASSSVTLAVVSDCGQLKPVLADEVQVEQDNPSGVYSQTADQSSSAETAVGRNIAWSASDESSGINCTKAIRPASLILRTSEPGSPVHVFVLADGSLSDSHMPDDLREYQKSQPDCSPHLTAYTESSSDCAIVSDYDRTVKDQGNTPGTSH